MKAITIKQPWASLIVSDIKDIENRSWPTKYRGRVLVHTSAAPVKGLLCEILNDMQYASVFSAEKLNTLLGPNGAIIGSVEIVDCVINHPSIWAEKSYHAVNCNSLPFHEEDEKDSIIFNWVLANPILFPEPIPAKGKLSFWDYPNIIAEPEEKNGDLFCYCQIPVKKKSQVMSLIGEYRCNYCGGKWYK